jgi:hypothetical protein
VETTAPPTGVGGLEEVHLVPTAMHEVAVGQSMEKMSSKPSGAGTDVHVCPPSVLARS